ncbi:MAG: Card1-like endonuclease domain-containing protein, partial [Sphaerospermopsis kisseleviana]
MSEKVMLVLIGGRSAVPTVAGVLQFLDEVDKIKFILCKGGQYLQYQKNVETVIKQNRQDLIFNNETDVITVDPNKFDEVYMATKKLCQDVKQIKYVNLTSVPQTMAISVYSYVQEKFKDVLVFSVNTDQSQIIPLVFGRQPLSFNKRLTVENYVAMYGLNIFRRQLVCERYIENTAQYIVDNLEIARKILYVIRKNSGDADTIKTAPKGFNINETEFTKLGVSISDLEGFLQKLESLSLLSKLQKLNGNIKFRIETKENYSFIAGGWLEVFVYSSAKLCKFDSVEIGVTIDNYRGEIDVFCLNSANAMICECKTGGKLKSKDLYD